LVFSHFPVVIEGSLARILVEKKQFSSLTWLVKKTIG